MKYRELRKTGMMISEISLGSWQTFGQAVDSKSSRECVAAALDAGINFFDTADVYGFGDAERLLGECFRDVPREKYRIGTKCFSPMSDDPADRGLSRQHVFRSVERSLRNLGVGPIDLFQCHRFDPSVPLVETVEALNDLVRKEDPSLGSQSLDCRPASGGFDDRPISGVRGTFRRSRTLQSDEA